MDLRFVAIRNVTARGDHLLVEAQTVDHTYNFELTPDSAMQLLRKMLMEASKISHDAQASVHVATAYQPIQTHLGPGILVQLANSLRLPLALNGIELEALRACIDQLIAPEDQSPKSLQ